MITINVTQEDIAQGVAGKCPITAAIRRVVAAPIEVTVSRVFVCFSIGTSQAKTVRLPDVALKTIASYDYCKRFCRSALKDFVPFSFSLDIPAEFVRTEV